MSAATEVLDALARQIGPGHVLNLPGGPAASWALLEVYYALALWEDKHNPHFVDYAVKACHTAWLEIPPELERVALDAAKKRLEGSQPGEAKQVEREMQWFDGYMLMAIGKWRGLNQTAARDFALEKNPDWNGEVLYKYYTKNIKNQRHEKVFKSTLERFPPR